MCIYKNILRYCGSFMVAYSFFIVMTEEAVFSQHLKIKQS